MSKENTAASKAKNWAIAVLIGLVCIGIVIKYIDNKKLKKIEAELITDKVYQQELLDRIKGKDYALKVAVEKEKKNATEAIESARKQLTQSVKGNTILNKQIADLKQSSISSESKLSKAYNLLSAKESIITEKDEIIVKLNIAVESQKTIIEALQNNIKFLNGSIAELVNQSKRKDKQIESLIKVHKGKWIKFGSGFHVDFDGSFAIDLIQVQIFTYLKLKIPFLK